jgi:hypothetical protein
MLDSYFLHVMKMCTIQGCPKVHPFPLRPFNSENFYEKDVFDKIVKLTNVSL